jgi:hypothetical protein
MVSVSIKLWKRERERQLVVVKINNPHKTSRWTVSGEQRRRDNEW